jgi:hypothetical protein
MQTYCKSREPSEENREHSEDNRELSDENRELSEENRERSEKNREHSDENREQHMGVYCKSCYILKLQKPYLILYYKIQITNQSPQAKKG